MGVYCGTTYRFRVPRLKTGCFWMLVEGVVVVHASVLHVSSYPGIERHEMEFDGATVISCKELPVLKEGNPVDITLEPTREGLSAETYVVTVVAMFWEAVGEGNWKRAGWCVDTLGAPLHLAPVSLAMHGCEELTFQGLTNSLDVGGSSVPQSSDCTLCLSGCELCASLGRLLTAVPLVRAVWSLCRGFSLNCSSSPDGFLPCAAKRETFIP